MVIFVDWVKIKARHILVKRKFMRQGVENPQIRISIQLNTIHKI